MKDILRGTPEAVIKALSAGLPGIYHIRNTRNGKVYVGSSADLLTRLQIHLRALRRGDHHSAYLQNSWNKHGEGTFEFSVMRLCLVEQLIKEEQIDIDLFQSADERFGYNMAPIAGGTRGMKRTAEQNAAKSALMSGRQYSPEYREILADRNREQMARPGVREKISASLTGKKQSAETVAKRIAKTTGKKRTPEAKALISAKAKSRFDDPAYRTWFGERMKARKGIGAKGAATRAAKKLSLIDLHEQDHSENPIVH